MNTENVFSVHETCALLCFLSFKSFMQLYFWPLNPKASQLCQYYVAQCCCLSWTDSSFLLAAPLQHPQFNIGKCETKPMRLSRKLNLCLWYPQLWSLAHNSFQSRTSRLGPAVQNPQHVWGCKANITVPREAARAEVPPVKAQGFSKFNTEPVL